jgi:hypothetical protein
MSCFWRAGKCSLSLYKRRLEQTPNSQSQYLPRNLSLSLPLSLSLYILATKPLLQMVVSFKPPPPPDVPLASKPSVFHLYTGPAGRKLNPRRDLANGMLLWY